MFELAILGLLTDQELHGYELKKRLSEALGPASGASFGSLYPALARLEQAGAVEAVDQRGDLRPVPSTGSLGGEIAAHRARRVAVRGTRGKKVYRITAEGRTLFEELLAAGATSSDDDRLFAMRLVFAGHLPPEARLGMLERRRLHLLDRLAGIRSRVRAGVDRWDVYGRSLAEHDREITEHDISWLERLIAAERAAAGAVPPSSGRVAPPAPEGRSNTPASESPPPPAPTWADRPSLSGLRRAAPGAAPQEDSQ